MPGTVERTPGAAVVKNVPAMSYTTGCDSFVLALRSVAAALNIEVSYATLKGLSATAFRLIFSRNWQRYAPDALRGYDHTRLAYGALGLHADPLTGDPQNAQNREDARRVIVECIDAGFPVMGLQMMGWEDWGVIAGYRDDGETLLCRTPHAAGDELAPARNWPWMIQAVSVTGPQPPRKGAMQRALRVAVELFETPEYDDFLSGEAAYHAWIDGLHEDDFYAPYESGSAAEVSARMAGLLSASSADLSHDRPFGLAYLERAHVNHWRFKSLLDARRAAAVYLEEASALFGGEPGARLGAAGRDYEEVATLLAMAQPFVPAEGSLAQTPWSQRQRDKQAALMQQALDVEEAAIQAIRAALARMHNK